jgi:selenocysteine-specific elongation factor
MGGVLAASLFSRKDVDKSIKDLIRQGKLAVSGQMLVDAEYWLNAGQKLMAMTQELHDADKLKRGISQAEAMASLGVERELFDNLVLNLVSAGKLVRLEDMLALPGHNQQLSGPQEAQAAQIRKLFQKSGAIPPTMKELASEMPGSIEIVKYLVRQGELVEMPEGVLLTASQFASVRDEVVRLLKEKGQIAIQDISSRFGYSRKFSIPLLTQLDRLGITRREGDVRVAGKKTAQ